MFSRNAQCNLGPTYANQVFEKITERNSNTLKDWRDGGKKKAYFYVRGNLETRWASWAYGSNNDLNLVECLNSSIVVAVVNGFHLQQLLLFLFNNLSHTI